MATHNEDLDIDFLDLDEISDAPPVLPTDDYPARIVEAEVRTAKDGGKYVSYSASVTAGPFAGRRVYGIWSLKTENLWRMKRDFKKLGYEPEGGVPRVRDLMGLEGTVTIVAQPKKDENGENTDEQENRIRGWKVS